MEDPITTAIRAIVQEEIRVAQRKNEPPRLEPVPPFRLYSVKSAAELLDVSVDYIAARLKDRSILRHVDLGSSRAKYRIRADELQRFIDSRTVTTAR